MTTESALRPGLYLVTPDWTDTARLAALLPAVLATRPAALQYRNKLADAALQRVQTARLLPLCRAAEVPFIINDDLALALECGADGVHLGRRSASVADARAFLGDDVVLFARVRPSAGVMAQPR